jgi:predicted O-linked N-acetylglucosamine transferase (SPINDLY family)
MNLGNFLKSHGQLKEAAIYFLHATKLHPEYVVAHGNLATTLIELGQIEAAVASFYQAVLVQPDFAAGHSNLLFVLNYTTIRGAEACLSEAKRYGAMVAKKAGSRFLAWKCERPVQRLRIGFVSADIINHPVGFFLDSLISQLDFSRIELVVYHNNLRADDLTERIRPYCTQWREILGLDDQSVAELIHADGIHVLVDLSGHTSKNRLPVFAWKPAPVQVAWLGYFATTGVAEMDYLLADPMGVPENQQSNFTEEIWYLPETRLCFSPPSVDLPVAPSPSLLKGYITFGCVQNLAKISDDVLRVWGEIFKKLPNARLRLACKQLGDPTVATQLMERLELHGIAKTRITMHGSVSRVAYLAAYAEVDILLDTFPYPGGTTTCEALWMGVPTLTLAGETLLARQGASLLTAAALPNWIAVSKTDYIEKATHFASNFSQLSALRSQLREQVRHSALYDAPRFARHFETALWAMWHAKSPNLFIEQTN